MQGSIDSHATRASAEPQRPKAVRGHLCGQLAHDDLQGDCWESCEVIAAICNKSRRAALA